MLLFSKPFHAGLVSGAITLTFRAWEKPHVKSGGRYRCHPIGVLEVLRVDRVALHSIGDEDAVRSGFANSELLKQELIARIPAERLSPSPDQHEVFRVELRYGGDGDYVAGSQSPELPADESREIAAKLAALDARSDCQWTEETLRLIVQHPHIAASKLAKMLGQETQSFKAQVVKLKKLGLTQSFEVGYELTPRGATFLQQTMATKPEPR